MEVTKSSAIPLAKRHLVSRDASGANAEHRNQATSKSFNKRLSPALSLAEQAGEQTAVEDNVRQWLFNSGKGFLDMDASMTRVALPSAPRSLAPHSSPRINCASSVVSSPAAGRNSFRGAPHQQPQQAAGSMRKTLSDNCGDFRGGSAPDGRYLESRFSYSVNGALGSAAQASAAAAFFARATQKMNLAASPNRRVKRQGSEDDIGPLEHKFSFNFYNLLRRNPPPAPANLLRRLANRENPGVGKVKVVLRLCGSMNQPSKKIDFLSIDKKRKQISIHENNSSGISVDLQHPEDRRVGVAAPKMFAFDGLFTQEDSQMDVASSVLSDIITAVINGSDGCVFTFGDSASNKTYTALGNFDSPANVGLIPAAIAWLFRGIAEQKAKTGSRFSVRVSAVEVSGSNEVLRDLLASHATESEQSPGVYLRDDPLLGTQLQNQSELRAPSLEKAAFYLDAALSARAEADQRFSHLLYTLHVYQYSLDKSGRGGVAGGRSRLHLLDLGSPSPVAGPGSLSHSGLSNIVVALFNGQRHLPHRDRKITQLLRECLSSLTCHAALVAHVSADSSHSETLTTAQMASRIHRMRRRRLKNFGNAPDDARNVVGIARSSGEESSASADPSSSEQSCDTVIYMGPLDDATDGEHPPVYLPSLNSGDNRCAMSKPLRGSSAEDSDGSRHSRLGRESKIPKIPKAHKIPTVAKSPKISEQWIDGPKAPEVRPETRPEVRSIVKANQIETWVDGPSALTGSIQIQTGYGYMDDHKRGMIRHWVETQSLQTNRCSALPESTNEVKALTVFKTCEEAEPELEDTPTKRPLVPPKPSQKVIGEKRREKERERETKKETSIDDLCNQCDELVQSLKDIPEISTRCETIPEADSEDERNAARRSALTEFTEELVEVEEREVFVPTQDSCLQVTEEDIVKSLLSQAKQEDSSSDQSSSDGEEHPLRVLSQENLTIVSHFTGETYSQGTASEWEYSHNKDDESGATPTEANCLFQAHLEHLEKLQKVYEPSPGLLNPPSLSSVAPDFTSFTDLPLYTHWDSVASPGPLQKNPTPHWDNVASPEPLHKIPTTHWDSVASPEPLHKNPTPHWDSLASPEPLCKNPTPHWDSVASPKPPLRHSLIPIAISGSRVDNRKLLSSLRHPDGASDPHLNHFRLPERRLPGNGASKSDTEQEMFKITNQKARVPAGKSDSELDDPANVKNQSKKTPKFGRIFTGSSQTKSRPPTNPKASRKIAPKFKDVKSYGFTYEHGVSSSLSPSEGYESGGSDSVVSPYLSRVKSRRNAALGKSFACTTGTGGSAGSGGHYASSGYESVMRDSECSSLSSSQDSDREANNHYTKAAIVNGQSSSCNIL